MQISVIQFIVFAILFLKEQFYDYFVIDLIRFLDIHDKAISLSHQY